MVHAGVNISTGYANVHSGILIGFDKFGEEFLNFWKGKKYNDKTKTGKIKENISPGIFWRLKTVQNAK